ncbi:MAG: hypothetical protein WD801_15265 [Gemmatimonadaceae bacterium]
MKRTGSFRFLPAAVVAILFVSGCEPGVPTGVTRSDVAPAMLDGGTGQPTFTAVQDGVWDSPATWGGTVPSVASTKVIPEGISVQGSFPTGVTNSGIIKNAGRLHSFEVNNSGSIANTGTLEIVGVNTGSINNAPDAELWVHPSSRFENRGTIVTAGLIDVAVHRTNTPLELFSADHGLINFSRIDIAAGGEIRNNGTFENAAEGLVHVAQDGTLRNHAGFLRGVRNFGTIDSYGSVISDRSLVFASSGQFFNFGTINIQATGELINRSTFTNQFVVVILGRGRNVHIIENHAIIATLGILDNFPGGRINNSSLLSVPPGGVLDNSRGASIVHDNIDAASLGVAAGGTVLNEGTVTGVGTLQNDGFIRNGSFGTLSSQRTQNFGNVENLGRILVPAGNSFSNLPGAEVVNATRANGGGLIQVAGFWGNGNARRTINQCRAVIELTGTWSGDAVREILCTPSLTAPAQDATVALPRPSLEWHAGHEVREVLYAVSLAGDTDPSTPLGVTDPAADEDQAGIFRAKPAHDLQAGRYTWSVTTSLSPDFAPGYPFAFEAVTTDPGAFDVPAFDETPPIIAPVISGTLGDNGWYRSNVSVSWSVSDAESTVSSSEGCTTVNVEQDTPGVTLTCTAESPGGMATQSATIRRDATVPQVSASRSPVANANGWNNTSVTVSASGVDATSGIASCTTAAVTADGAGQEGIASCTDGAGNTASVTLGDINIDKTAPTVTGTRRIPEPNAHGWNNVDVTIEWGCSDGRSGVDRTKPFDVTVTTEGAGQSGTGTCFDNAGNTATVTVGDVNIDKTAPTVTGTRRIPEPNAHGWNSVDVTIEWGCSDGQSGVDRTKPFDVTVTSDGAGQSGTGTCFDHAGNTATVIVGDVNIDRVPPSVTGTPSRAPDRNGWYRMPLGIAWSGNDGLSGVASCAPAANYSGPDGANAGVGGTCRDHADNEGAGAFGFKYDATSPVITFTGNQGSYNVDQTVRITCSATDAASGIDAGSTTCPEIDAPAYTFAVGSHSIVATATDAAGNVRTESSTFTVEVTYQSLGNVIDLVVSNDGVASSLEEKLVAASNAPTAGARAGQLRAFVNQVNAHRGRQISSRDADVLIKLAGGL